ncbi:hypothetical protein [Haloplasma contractile]|uniref:YopJ Serine/Threonine acetyltransferase protein n=1 Tax=Haloplasma contractile SSD-17B TaxID=1033810 RepID=U2EEZ1_9MOLU|nr:hypothetical protein [Haloplasma contractile]ERJ13261.1 YopJ Serine/Threonine acetyltransferase protein [Haloplasma contractile SSD-17B]
MKKEIQFTLDSPDSNVYEKIITFWEERGFTFTEKNKNYLIGNRGNIIHNLYTFKMQKLDTKVSIKISNNEINTTLDINTMFQMITAANKRYWELELQTYKSAILNNDYREDDWIDFKQQQNKSNIGWTLLFAFIGFISGLIFIFLFL